MSIDFDKEELWVDFADGEFCHFPSGRLTMWSWSPGSVGYKETVLRK